MDVYTPGTDHFDPEYLAYLGTLTSEVGVVNDSRARITHDRNGEFVRIEIWTSLDPDDGDDHTRPYGHVSWYGEKWMKPDYSLE